MSKIKYVAPKYPRVSVSLKRHKALAEEASKRDITIERLAEEKLAR